MTHYPYLDLSVLPKIRELVVSSRAVIVTTDDLFRVLWANGEGTRLLGKRRVSDALETGFLINSVMTRQISGAVARLEGQNTVNATMRPARGLKKSLINFAVSRITLPDGIEAVLLITDPLYGRSHSIGEMAASAVSCLDGSNHVSAVLDFEGTIINASNGFRALDVDTNVLAELVHEVAGESDRMVKRLITTGETRMAAGIARLTENPDVHLLILANNDEDIAGEKITDAPTITSDTSGQRIEIPDKEQTVANIDTASDMRQRAKLFSSRRPRLKDGDGGQSFGRWYYRQPDVQDEVEEADATVGHFIEAESNLKDRLNLEIDVPALGDGLQEIADSKEFQFTKSAQTVRFAWRMDESSIFTSVSPELASTVGPYAAATAGVAWRELANRIGIDEDHSISDLLERGDTWSGKSVLWPVQGTDLRVPVDLAGLPSFGPDRQFSGYHGFGTIRTVDAVVDVAETGLTLIGEGYEKTNDRTPSNDVDRNEDRITVEPDGDVFSPGSTSDQTGDDDNIVDLTAQRHARMKRQLSLEERTAFEEIGDKLADDGSTPKEPSPQHARKDRKVEDRDYLPSAFAGLSTGDNQKVNTSILVGLPIPVLIFKDNDLLFANLEFAKLTGYESTDELFDKGGIEALLGIPDGEQDGYTRITHKNGMQVPVKANLQSVPWRGSRALLLALREEHNRPEEISWKPGSAELSLSEIQSAVEDNSLISSFDDISSRGLSGILNTATDGVIVLTESGEIRSINRAAEALFGQENNDVVGKDFTHLLARESHRTARDYLSGLSENGVASVLNDGREMIGKEVQGGLFPLFVTMGRLEESEGYCAVLRDITQWKKAEEDLVSARRQAELASDQKTDFLAKISHEIRTPLNAIIGFSEVMLEERFGKISIDRYREYLRDINRSGSHVLELVNDLLDISKIEAGKLDLDFSEVNLNDVIAEGVALTQPQANRNHIIIRTSLSGAVPPVVADARSIRQIVLNLVSNAIKYTKAGGQVIVSTVFEESGEVVLRVRDTGIGMSESDIVTAMTPFRRVQTVSNNRGEGTGLGLPLTKALVEANLALFSIESTPGEGTLVEIYFPSTRVLTE